MSDEKIPLPITHDSLPFGEAKRRRHFMDELKNLVEVMAKALVDHPDQVVVSEIEGEQTAVLELRVAKEDLGKVIGKEGRTARSLRTIIGAASAKLKRRSVLEILE